MNSGSENIVGLKAQAEELRGRLKANPAFGELPAEKQKKALNGKIAFLEPLETIAEKSGTSVNTFRWLYRLLSSHAHVLPMSFQRMHFQERGRGVHSEIEEGQITLCLSFTTDLLAEARGEMEGLFRPLIASSASAPSRPAAI